MAENMALPKSASKAFQVMMSGESVRLLGRNISGIIEN